MRTARAAAPLLSVGSPKLARGLAGRREAHEVLRHWGENERDPGRPCLWVHAPSVGEGLQAGAVIAALRARRPGLQVAFTHFSPSAQGWGPRIGADVSAYLPWDLSETTSRALDGVRPNTLVFTKTEVWPVLVEQARRRGVPVAMVAGTVPADAGRLRWPTRSVLHATWSSLALGCACSEADAASLVAMGLPLPSVHVTGDPAIDAAAERAEAADASSMTLAPFHADRRPTVVAGSTWPEDEAVLLPALEDVRRSSPAVRLVVTPHEPTPDRVRELMARLASSRWTVDTLGAVEGRGSAGGVDAVVVDRVGVLAHLYTVADVAYVGGGFGRRGLHSVLEPAAARVPVLFGPRHGRSAAAGELVRGGGARAVPDRASLSQAVMGWLGDQAVRSRAGEHAFVYISSHRGAARRTADLLDPLLLSHPPE